jgi:prepilin-type N-terminal cleavage/methylation domain-containing protein
MKRDMKPNRKMSGTLEKSLRRESRRKLRAFTLTEILAVMAILSLIIVSLFTIFRQGTETWRLSSARTEAYIKARQILEMMAREMQSAVMITAARGPGAEPTQIRSLKRADFVGLNGENTGAPGAQNLVTLQHWRDYGSYKEQPYSDQIYFVAPLTNSGKQDLCMIGYWVRDSMQPQTNKPLGTNDVPQDAKDDVLMKNYLTDGYSSPTKDWMGFRFEKDSAFDASRWEVASSVRQLSIQFYDYEDTGGTTRRLTPYNTWDSLPSSKGGSTSTKDDDNKLPVAVRITIAVGDENDVIKPIKLSRIVFLDNAGQR